MSLPLARETVIAQESRKAANMAIRLPNRLPVPSDEPTMIEIPTTISAMASRVCGRGRSRRNSHDNSAENMALNARMNTRSAVEVLKTAVMNMIELRP
jgi:hypothetical protein